MPLHIGNQKIESIFKGNSAIGKVYKGNTLVFDSAGGGGGSLPAGLGYKSYIVSANPLSFSFGLGTQLSDGGYPQVGDCLILVNCLGGQGAISGWNVKPAAVVDSLTQYSANDFYDSRIMLSYVNDWDGSTLNGTYVGAGYKPQALYILVHRNMEFLGVRNGNGGANGATCNPPGVTPTVDNSIIYTASAIGRNSTGGAGAWTNPSGMTKITNAAPAQGAMCDHMLSKKTDWVSGFYDPSAQPNSYDGNGLAASCAVTFAVSPKV